MPGSPLPVPVFAFVLVEPTTLSLVNARVNPSQETCAPTGTTMTVDKLIIAAVANLRTDLGIASTLRLDDYETNLNFVQKSVPTRLDDSVLYLTGLLGKTIVSNIVDQAALAVRHSFVQFSLATDGFISSPADWSPT